MPVVLDLGADVECDEPDCKRSVPADVCLAVDGSMLFRPTAHGGLKDWALTVGSNGVYACRCPEHRQTITVAPASAVPLRKTH